MSAQLQFLQTNEFETANTPNSDRAPLGAAIFQFLNASALSASQRKDAAFVAEMQGYPALASELSSDHPNGRTLARLARKVDLRSRGKILESLLTDIRFG